MNSLASLLHAAFHQPGHPAHRLVEGTIWTLIALSIVLFATELALGEDFPDLPWLAWVDRAVLAVFTVEISLRVLTFRPPMASFVRGSRWQRARLGVTGRFFFLLRPLMLIDLLTVLAVVPALRGLRALRLLRLLRSVRVFKYSDVVLGIERAFTDNALLYGIVFSLLGTSVIVGGASIFLIERTATPPNPDIHNLGDGLWWAIVTVTTVGFGDMAPTSALGRVVAGVLMVAGMFFLALFAGMVGNTLLSVFMEIRKEQFRMSGYVGHIVVCGYNSGSRLLLDALAREHDLAGREVVLFAPMERPTDVPARFRWIHGDPQKESELEKARVAHASSVVLVGARDLEPQRADASTILTVFTIRKWLARQPVTARRARPLYIVAEILEDENVAHARTAGADEVVETNWVGFSLVAHAVTSPGAAQVIESVAIAGANNLYVGPIPSGIELPMPFGDLIGAVKRQTGALLIGIRDPSNGEETLNPPHDQAIEAGIEVIYLATQRLDPAVPPAGVG